MMSKRNIKQKVYQFYYWFLYFNFIETIKNLTIMMDSPNEYNQNYDGFSEQSEEIQRESQPIQNAQPKQNRNKTQEKYEIYQKQPINQNLILPSDHTQDIQKEQILKNQRIKNNLNRLFSPKLPNNSNLNQQNHVYHSQNIPIIPGTIEQTNSKQYESTIVGKNHQFKTNKKLPKGALNPYRRSLHMVNTNKSAINQNESVLLFPRSKRRKLKTQTQINIHSSYNEQSMKKYHQILSNHLIKENQQKSENNQTLSTIKDTLSDLYQKKNRSIRYARGFSQMNSKKNLSLDYGSPEKSQDRVIVFIKTYVYSHLQSVSVQISLLDNSLIICCNLIGKVNEQLKLVLDEEKAQKLYKQSFSDWEVVGKRISIQTTHTGIKYLRILSLRQLIANLKNQLQSDQDEKTEESQSQRNQKKLKKLKQKIKQQDFIKRNYFSFIEKKNSINEKNSQTQNNPSNKRINQKNESVFHTIDHVDSLSKLYLQSQIEKQKNNRKLIGNARKKLSRLTKHIDYLSPQMRQKVVSIREDYMNKIGKEKDSKQSEQNQQSVKRLKGLFQRLSKPKPTLQPIERREESVHKTQLSNQNTFRNRQVAPIIEKQRNTSRYERQSQIVERAKGRNSQHLAKLKSNKKQDVGHLPIELRENNKKVFVNKNDRKRMLREIVLRNQVKRLVSQQQREKLNNKRKQSKKNNWVNDDSEVAEKYLNKEEEMINEVVAEMQVSQNEVLNVQKIMQKSEEPMDDVDMMDEKVHDLLASQYKGQRQGIMDQSITFSLNHNSKRQEDQQKEQQIQALQTLIQHEQITKSNQNNQHKIQQKKQSQQLISKTIPQIDHQHQQQLKQLKQQNLIQQGHINEHQPQIVKDSDNQKQPQIRLSQNTKLSIEKKQHNWIFNEEQKKVISHKQNHLKPSNHQQLLQKQQDISQKHQQITQKYQKIIHKLQEKSHKLDQKIQLQKQIVQNTSLNLQNNSSVENNITQRQQIASITKPQTVHNVSIIQNRKKSLSNLIPSPSSSKITEANQQKTNDNLSKKNQQNNDKDKQALNKIKNDAKVKEDISVKITQNQIIQVKQTKNLDNNSVNQHKNHSIIQKGNFIIQKENSTDKLEKEVQKLKDQKNRIFQDESNNKNGQNKLCSQIISHDKNTTTQNKEVNSQNKHHKSKYQSNSQSVLNENNQIPKIQEVNKPSQQQRVINEKVQSKSQTCNDNKIVGYQQENIALNIKQKQQNAEIEPNQQNVEIEKQKVSLYLQSKQLKSNNYQTKNTQQKGETKSNNQVGKQYKKPQIQEPNQHDKQLKQLKHQQKGNQEPIIKNNKSTQNHEQTHIQNFKSQLHKQKLNQQQKSLQKRQNQVINKQKVETQSNQANKQPNQINSQPNHNVKTQQSQQQEPVRVQQKPKIQSKAEKNTEIIQNQEKLIKTETKESKNQQSIKQKPAPQLEKLQQQQQQPLSQKQLLLIKKSYKQQNIKLSTSQKDLKNDNIVNQNQPLLQKVTQREQKENMSQIQLKKQHQINMRENQSLNQNSSKKEKQRQEQHPQSNLQSNRQSQSYQLSLTNQSTKSKSLIRQSNQEISEKYQALQPYFNPNAKFILIDHKQLDLHLQKFYSSFSLQQREMLLYTQDEIFEKINSLFETNQPVDLFNCNSIGWYDLRKRKYLLFGSLQCVHLITNKYGSIQIETFHIFNKESQKQKKYLTKYMKQFEKFGFLYQKKIKTKGHYEIKGIIKVPKQNSQRLTLIEKSLHIKSFFSINTPLAQPKFSPKNLETKHNNIFWHFLGGCLMNDLTKQDLKKYIDSCQNQSIDTTLFTQSLKNQKLFEQIAPYIICEEQNTAQFEMSFDLPYVQLGNQTFLSLQSKQYSVGKFNQKVYLAYNSNQTEEKIEQQLTWKLLVFEADKSIIKHNYLETYLTNKINEINNEKPEKDVRLLVPAFSVKSNLRMTEDDDFKKSFIHRSSISCDLIPSSISVSASLSNDNRKIIELSEERENEGFVFCVCSCLGEKIEKVLGGSWIGFKDQIIYDQFS